MMTRVIVAAVAVAALVLVLGTPAWADGFTSYTFIDDGVELELWSQGAEPPGGGQAPSITPEPATLALLGAGALAALARRRAA